MPRTVDLGGAADPDRILFNGSPDAFGVSWCAEGLTGWDSPDMELIRADHPLDDGQVRILGRHQGRPLDLIAATLLAPSEAARVTAMDRLAHTTDVLRSTRRLVVIDGAASRFADVHRREPVRMRLRPPAVDSRRGMVWPAALEVPLVAPDPRKYDLNETVAQTSASSGGTTGTATTVNQGNYATPWVATITASGWPGGALNLFTPDNMPVVNLTLVPAMTGSDALVVDSAKRTVTLNGVNRRDLVAALPDWSGIAPGFDTFSFNRANTTGSVLLQVAYRFAWI